MKQRPFGLAALGLVLLATGFSGGWARLEPVKSEPVGAGKEVASAAYQSIKAMVGRYEGKLEMGDAVIVFKMTAGGNAVVETMFPGSEHEMTNIYAMDGDDLFVVHYCAMGNQPKMKLTKVEDGAMHFRAVSVGNRASEDQPFMSSLVLSCDGETLKEKWGHTEKGKDEAHAEFVIKKVQ